MESFATSRRNANKMSIKFVEKIDPPELLYFRSIFNDIFQ